MPLSTWPVIGVVFGWMGQGIGWFLTQPPNLVVDTLRAGCNLVLGNCGG